ncbi:WYL domain-containing protein [Nocardioides silvaticus]|uniref:WYL domain-containing protein n=1 Tax=Nocardioides silvaticus TaxID=2201891 RepID=A0A316TNZ7_9ACTN|nr:WYL domain-containing protein [Nocardioides silvaticus]PWN03914.1 WYL domain-containing protein [Nocardioides silvaticus]
MTATSGAAAPGARDQVARLLTLVPFLHHRDQVRLADAAELLGTTPEQVLRDLKVLFMCGLPGGLPDDLIDVDLDAIESEEGGPVSDGVIRIENADYLARPLRLSPTEASAVQVALLALRDVSTADTQAIIDAVLAKLDAAAASAAAARRIAVDARSSDVAELALSDTLQRAADEQRQVRLTYHVPARDELSERVVDPRGVVPHGRFRYLDAWCHTAGSERLFRLDRITDALVLDTPTTTPQTPPREVTEGLLSGEAPPGGTVATLVLQPQADWVPHYYPMQEVREGADGVLEADLPVADPRWLMRLLLRLAPYASVKAPAEFAESFSATAQETLALYR